VTAELELTRLLVFGHGETVDRELGERLLAAQLLLDRRHFLGAAPVERFSQAIQLCPHLRVRRLEVGDVVGVDPTHRLDGLERLLVDLGDDLADPVAWLGRH